MVKVYYSLIVVEEEGVSFILIFATLRRRLFLSFRCLILPLVEITAGLTERFPVVGRRSQSRTHVLPATLHHNLTANDSTTASLTKPRDRLEQNFHIEPVREMEDGVTRAVTGQHCSP